MLAGFLHGELRSLQSFRYFSSDLPNIWSHQRHLYKVHPETELASRASSQRVLWAFRAWTESDPVTQAGWARLQETEESVYVLTLVFLARIFFFPSDYTVLTETGYLQPISFYSFFSFSHGHVLRNVCFHGCLPCCYANYLPICLQSQIIAVAAKAWEQLPFEIHEVPSLFCTSSWLKSLPGYATCHFQGQSFSTSMANKKKKKLFFFSYHPRLPWLLSLQFLLLLICAPLWLLILSVQLQECNHVVQFSEERGPLHHQPCRSFVSEEYRSLFINKDGCLA